MADRGDTHYHVRHLNLWFAASSAFLLITAFWMVIDDWSRPWKSYQRQFRQIEIERARAALEEPDARAALAEEEELADVLARAEERLEARRADLEEAEERLRLLKGDQFVATEAAKKAKQEFNWERWLTEEQRLHANDPTLGAERLDSYEDRLARLENAKKDVDAAVAEVELQIADLRADVADVEKDLKAATKDVDLTRKRLATIAPRDAPTKVANVIRDFPGLDFIGPSLMVNKVVLDDLTFELNFTKKRRIDMCHTCHVAIDRNGYDDEAQPFSSHPRLDLFLSAKSPHPMNQMGCTICHRGSGEALDFQRADHRASNEAEAEEWGDEHNWHKQHYWDYPMLSSEYVEASCVQCHKTSMELIAPEAPHVAEGYQLFERYGCYACHKVEWFPTKRRPGPTLTRLKSKTTKEFVDAWVADPKGFRPTTWMPRVFHLENYEADDEIARSEYGEGRSMNGAEWSDAAVAAVTAYVWNRAEDVAYPPIPVEGDALRGKEVFRLTGCLACHNMAPFTEEERAEARDLAQRLRGTNEAGPNLRGIATKVSPEWLFAWIKDPQAYWPETRMPDLRLSDQEAADVVAYLMEDPRGIFHDVPEGWEQGEVSYARDVLEEQARWFFNRLQRDELARRFREEWADDRVLLDVVGEKFVLNQGCHSCHEISGLENAQPIGTELTNWGSKTVDKLDWGFMHEIIAEQKGWDHHQKEELVQYREPWLEQKLHAPRSFDRRKVKNPTERLRMPRFDFTQEQISALGTFVVGLVDDEVQRAKMVPTAEEVQMDTGLRVVRQKNCAACHLIDPGTIEFDGIDGAHHSVEGQFFTLEDEKIPPPMRGFRAYLDDYVEWRRESDDEYEMEDLAIQLLRPEPGLGDVGDSIVIEDVASVRAHPAWGGDFVQLVAEYYLYPWTYDPEQDADLSATGDPEGQGRVQDVDGEWRSYESEPYDKIRWTFAPPSLQNEGGKLQNDWFYRFLLDPMPLREQLRVRMPTFHWDDGEAAAVADYFANRSQRDWPARYARKLALALGKTSEDLAVDMQATGFNGVSGTQLQAIMNGKQAETQALFPKLLDYGVAKDFGMAGPVDPAYESVPQRQPSHLDARLAEEPELFDKVHDLVVRGPNCVQCHFLKGRPPTAEGPVAWAPDLDLTRERLRPDWLREWLVDPSKIYPGTAMPANFPLDQRVWQDLYPRSSREQIEAVLTWLFNLDRAQPQN